MCLSKGEQRRGSSPYASFWAEKTLLQASQLLGKLEVLLKYPRVTSCYEHPCEDQDKTSLLW